MASPDPNNDPENPEMKHFISNVASELVKSKDSSLISSVLRDVTSAKSSPLSVRLFHMKFYGNTSVSSFASLYNSQFSPCLLLIIQASQISSSLQDSSASSGAPVSSTNSTVPVPNSSAEIYPRGSVRTRSSVNPTSGPTEHCATSMVAPHSRLKDRTIPFQEVDQDYELFSYHSYQNPRLLSDANQLITPIDGTSESIDVNASQSHRLEESRIDLSVHGPGIDDALAQVPVTLANHDGDRGCSRRSAICSHLDSDQSSFHSDDSSKADDDSVYSASPFLEKSAKHNSQVPRRSPRSCYRTITDSQSPLVSRKISTSATSTLSTKCVAKSNVSLPHTDCSFSSTFDRSKLPCFNDILYATYCYECVKSSKTPIQQPHFSGLLPSLDWSGVYAEVACSMCPSDFTCEFHL